MIEYVCGICKKKIVSKSWKGFSNHVSKHHRMSSSEYWTKYPYMYEEPTGEYGVDYVLCPICNNNRQFQSLTQHIINKHNLQVDEFKELYPDSIVFTTKYSDMRREFCRKGLAKNWSSNEYREKRSAYCSVFFHNLNSGALRPQNSITMTSTLNRLWMIKAYRDKQSEKAKKQHESGELTRAIINGQRRNWIKHTTVTGEVITLKGTYEPRFVKFLESHNIKYEYERAYKYYDTSRKKMRTYYADFYLPEYNTVAEVKAEWATSRQINIDKRKGVIDLGINYVYITEKELNKLDRSNSMKDFLSMIQGNITNVNSTSYD